MRGGPWICGTALVLLAAFPLLVAASAALSEVSLAGPGGDVTRGDQFTTSIHGDTYTEYFIWVEGSSFLSGAPGDQPPMLVAGQVGVARDPPGGPYTIGSRQVSGGRTIQDDVPPAPSGGTGYYALVTTDEGGTRTVLWATSQDTAAGSYTIRVEGGTGADVVYDEADVTVTRGTLSLRVGGQSISAYLGEEVDLTGRNTETSTTYLFVTGPNIPSSGGRLDSPRTPVADGDPASFTQAQVDTGGTWRYRWQTEGLGLDAGTYTIFAVSTPVSYPSLGDTVYGTTTVDLARSPVSSTAGTPPAGSTPPPASATTGIPSVDQGDIFRITGTAPGASQVAIWIFGTNRLVYGTETVDEDGSFSHELTRAVTASLAPGQYVAVIQHPGPLGILDVTPSPDRTQILLNVPHPGSSVNIAGLGASAGSYALISALDSPYIDDTSTTLTFLVTYPMVTVDFPGQVVMGRPVLITGTTSLAPGDHLIVSVYSSAFTPTPKNQGQFYGTSGSVTVQPGPGGVNTWSFPVDTSTFAAGQYIVLVSGIEVEVSDTTTFTLVPAPPSTVPTTHPPPETTATPAVTPTTATTTPVTPGPTSTPLPGFGLVAALSGLAVAAVLRPGKG
jgi:S-layer glycoprotein